MKGFYNYLSTHPKLTPPPADYEPRVPYHLSQAFTHTIHRRTTIWIILIALPLPPTHRDIYFLKNTIALLLRSIHSIPYRMNPQSRERNLLSANMDK